MRLYHFTSTYHLPLILAAGELAPTESNIGSPSRKHKPHGARVGPDVVWFTKSRVVPPGSHGLAGSIVDKAEVRITVEVDDAVLWSEFSSKHKIDPSWYAVLDARGLGTASSWWVVARAVPSSQWLEVRNLRTKAVSRPPFRAGKAGLR